MKVILDTNVLISFLISGLGRAIEDKIRERKILLVFSELSVQELVNVVNRNKFKQRFLRTDIEQILIFIQVHGIFIEVTSEVSICRDPDDNFLLALAKDSKSDYLVTGDKDLLVLNKFESTRIVRVPEFLNKL